MVSGAVAGSSWPAGGALGFGRVQLLGLLCSCHPVAAPCFDWWGKTYARGEEGECDPPFSVLRRALFSMVDLGNYSDGLRTSQRASTRIDEVTTAAALYVEQPLSLFSDLAPVLGYELAAAASVVASR